MKYLATCFLVFAAFFTTHSQEHILLLDSTELPSHSLRAIAKVTTAEHDYMIIVIENVVAYSSGISTTPAPGDELTVRLPGRNKPQNESRIEVDLKESIEVGALPSSYIVLNYRTIE